MLPTPTDKKCELLFAAIFGRFPVSGDLSECQKHFVDLLDAKEKVIDPLLLHTLSGANDLYPLRVGMYVARYRSPRLEFRPAAPQKGFSTSAR
jgi:hypothetical protein